MGRWWFWRQTAGVLVSLTLVSGCCRTCIEWARQRRQCCPRDQGDNPIPLSVHRLYATASRSPLIEDPAQGRNLHREVGLLDCASRPDNREDLIFCNELPLLRWPGERGVRLRASPRLAARRTGIHPHARVSPRPDRTGSPRTGTLHLWRTHPFFKVSRLPAACRLRPSRQVTCE
jgi:hypothetical protein